MHPWENKVAIDAGWPGGGYGAENFRKVKDGEWRVDERSK